MQRSLLLKNVILVTLFFVITPLALFASTISLLAFKDQNNRSTNFGELMEEPKYEARIYAPSDNFVFPSVLGEVVSGDARPETLRQYFEKSGSELLPHAQLLVDVADKYGLDFRLLPAIAQKESGLCRVIPEGSHNCWGWGIHSKGTLKFDSYPEAIETVAKGLREKYLDMGYVTPDQIMKKYAHPDSTTWADGVKMYMAQME